MRVDTASPAGDRVVIDTNIWLSAALSSRGSPAEVVSRVLTAKAHVFSDDTFAELRSRIWRTKFDRYLSREMQNITLHDASATAHCVDVPPDIAARRFSRDLDDDKFIHAALASGARWLVTGDADLLSINCDIGISIVTAAIALGLPDFYP